MSARALPFLTTGLVALVLAGCSGGGNDSAAPSGTATPPVTVTASPTPTTTPTTTPQPTTTPPSTPAKPGGAVERYEAYLHAVGDEDVTTACEIAAPAAKKAEDEGWGPCEKTLPISFQMFSAGQRKALRTATVDRGRVTEGPNKVEIPAKAVQAGVKFSSGDLGDAVLELRGGKWYITD